VGSSGNREMDRARAMWSCGGMETLGVVELIKGWMSEAGPAAT
jgi:hypothetical protein